MARWLEDR
ncbi:unnamed protein product [Linum tenue]|uniref:Uncharacterized protein n=1 Tax=Linum tenue TaxID=586396 RepID=A0AAV0KLA5_9ROSI|nr:unnamed protein product [Linum tenue]